MSDETDKPASGVRNLSTATKVLRMLDYVASLPGPSRLSEICASLRLQRGTAYQQLKTLVDAGWIEAREDGRYQLSLRSVAVAEMALKQMNLGERVEPILERLVQDTNETASITVMQSGYPVIIQRVEVDRAIVARQKIGGRLELMTSASGKIHIVFEDPKAVREIARLAKPPIGRKEAAEIRKTRVAFSEPGTGLLAAATPIFNAQGKCIAALSLVGLEQHNEILSAGKYLLAASTDISQLFSA
jgi:IclR family transcriptional regulator, pca regulon regulatory protein